MSAFTVRRVITGHNVAGRAVFVTDEQVEAEHRFIDLAQGEKTLDSADIWTAGTVPALNTGPAVNSGPADAGDAGNPAGTAPERTVVLRISELPPGSVSPMHRTQTLDYGILLAGTCSLMLDSGEVKHLQAGDVVIQRGTSHSWVNRGKVPCRWAWILISAEPVQVGGNDLPAEWRAAPEQPVVIP